MAKAKQVYESIKRRVITDAAVDAAKAAERYLTEVKRQLLQEIVEHPVSQELINHTAPSSFLEGTRGSLFGYLGFKKGSNPVKQLTDFLDKFWIIAPEKTFLGFFVGVRLRAKLKRPSKNDFKKAGLVLEWQKSLTWPYFLETSISNLPFFLSVGAGRSGEGLQLDKSGKETSDAQFGGVDYITGIFNKNRKAFAAKVFRIKK